MKKYRNSQKRFYGDGKIYYIVAKTDKNFPFFKERIFCDLLLAELKLCKELKEFKLYGFSIIYDHINILPEVGKKYNISQIMKSLKENISRDINYIINNTIYEGDTSTCRLHLRKMIIRAQDSFIKGGEQFKNNTPPFKWQKSFYDHVIRNEKDFSKHYAHTVLNHIKHNLPEDWKYCSENHIDLIDYIET